MNAHRRSSSVAPTTGSARTVVTVARLLGKSIIARTGRSVGRVDDIVVRVDGGTESPPVTGIVARGRRAPGVLVDQCDQLAWVRTPQR